MPEPAEQRQQDHEQPEARREQRREDDQHVERRHRAPDLVEALHARCRSSRRSSPGSRRRARRAPRRSPVTSSANTTETRKPYSSRASRSRPRSSVPSRLSRVGGAGIRLLGEVVDRAVVIGVGRKQREVAGLREVLADQRIEVVGGRREVAAERGLRQRLHDREVPLPFVAHDQRLVVRQHLGEQAQAEQRRRNSDQADVAEPVAAEAPPRAAPGSARTVPARCRAGVRRWRCVMVSRSTSRADRPRRSSGRAAAW